MCPNWFALLNLTHFVPLLRCAVKCVQCGLSWTMWRCSVLHLTNLRPPPFSPLRSPPSPLTHAPHPPSSTRIVIIAQIHTHTTSSRPHPQAHAPHANMHTHARNATHELTPQRTPRRIRTYSPWPISIATLTPVCPCLSLQLVHMCSLLSALMVQHLQQQEDLSSLVATRIGKAALLKSLGQSRSSSRSSHGPKGSGQTSDAVAAPSSPTVVQDSIEVLGGLTPEEREVLEGSQVRRD